MKVKPCRDGDCHENEWTCTWCEGSGQAVCDCDDTCNNPQHERECPHCSGDGQCPWSPDAYVQQRAQVEFDEFMAQQSFGCTDVEFDAAWRRMFGAPPPASAMTEFFDKYERIAIAAGRFKPWRTAEYLEQTRKAS